MGRPVQLPPQAVVVVGVLAALGLAYSTFFSRPAAGQTSPPPAAARHEPVPAATVPALAEPPVPRVAPAAPTRSERTPAYLVARPERARELVVRARPGGAVVARVGARTEFGSQQTMAVAERRGRWLGVVTAQLPNGELGWIHRRESPVRLTATRRSLVLDLSRRLLVLKQGNSVLRRMTVGIGRPESPTPAGRFAVTDKLRGSRYGSYYGCCILALSAHQPNLPPGWPGGDRIAIHGTNDRSSIGTASSAGCPHARDADLRYLFRRLPLGTPVFIHA